MLRFVPLHAKRQLLPVVLGGVLGCLLIASPPATADNSQTPPGLAADEVALSIPQARRVAVEALSKKQPQIAAQIAAGLLQRDPSDAFAHYVLARAMQQMHHPAKGQRAAARAFRNAKTQTQKYEASQLAATLAYERGRPGMAQLWLRRSWNHVPNKQARAALQRDYRVLRHLNPWQLNGRLSIVPSDNVNNGARDPFALIDGVPVVGILSGSALALPGVKTVADATVAYRLSRTRDKQTRLTGRLYLNRVSLSDTAYVTAPGVRNKDFAYTDLAVGLDHQRNTAQGILGYDVALGRSWYAGQPYQDKLSMGLTYDRPLTDGARTQVFARAQHATPKNGMPVLRQLNVGANWSKPMINGNRLSLGLSAKLVDTATSVQRETRATGHVSYQLGDPIGPAKVKLTLGASVGHYPDYRLGPIVVPGGRDDQALFGTVQFTFEKWDYAGFVPSITLQTQKTKSNVSRFETREFSVSMGILSRF